MAVQKGGQSSFKRFLKENRTLTFSIPILLVLVIVVLIVYSNPGGIIPDKSVPASVEGTGAELQGNRVDILPQTERSAVEGTADSKGGSAGQPVKNDPFSGPLKLVGVVIGGGGKNMAVLESGGRSYVLQKGDVLDNGMSVESISEEEIRLKDGERQVSVKLEQPKKDQTAVN
jgi:hypothetical protein